MPRILSARFSQALAMDGLFRNEKKVTYYSMVCGSRSGIPALYVERVTDTLNTVIGEALEWSLF